MPVFSKECLEALRLKVDLVEVVNPYLNCKRSGSTYKALCPFHNEKSPSFIINQGDSHYHCFGCGAHGDAIAFLMSFLKVTFIEAVEVLAEKFGVVLEYEKDTKERGKDYSFAKKALNEATDFFHFHLLHTDEGHQAMEYLFNRGIDLDFIKRFKIGFSPKDDRFSLAFFREKRHKEEDLLLAGLLTKTDAGKIRPFFSNRVMFPIMDMMHATIGYSARKIHEDTFGGKYINTSKTPLFNKSRVLFGLNYCRSRIAKEQKAIIVEGQIDALRLIQMGLDYTVAGQGTAFGEGHVDNLRKIGVKHAFLAFDGDEAGREAAVKVGQLFQIEGIEVSVAILPKGMDPDGIVRTSGIDAFKGFLDKCMGYIPFVVKMYSQKLDLKTPAGKNELANQVSLLIRAWKHPIMIHEGLKLLSSLLQIPESMLGSAPPIPKVERVQRVVNADRILELDFLRWLILMGKENESLWEIALENVTEELFLEPECRGLFRLLLQLRKEKEVVDLLSLGQHLDESGDELIKQILAKKVNTKRAEEGLVEATQRMLERNWMYEREMIKMKIQGGKCEESEALLLAQEFDLLKKARPKVKR